MYPDLKTNSMPRLLFLPALTNIGRSDMAENRAFRSALGLLVIGSTLLIAGTEAQTVRNTQSGTISSTTPATLRIPAGISFKVRLQHALNSGNATPGTNWDGVLADDLVSPQGRVYAAAGTPVSGVVASVKPGVNNQPGAISLRATAIDGVELHTDYKTRTGSENDGSGGLLQSEGGLNSHGGRVVSSDGFATSTVAQQANLSAGALLTFNTSVP